ncbi:MFS transporter [Parapedobacter koreensis]|uniref:Nucleoside transporter n=1 Tax=Parapedobacter koreensis TaxID=332977 RepID=A0A1H7L5T6_9SPHI|nr:MFS transporter [Parapedobacter koreensis]SEK94362.1 nucleoside transporter [Parapedobacter koreensis]
MRSAILPCYSNGKGFPLIRVFQTSTSSLLLGILSFFLPDTPPNRQASPGLSATLGFDALFLFKRRSFVVFFLASIAVCIPLSFYYNFTNPFLNDVGMEHAAGKMTLGQFSEFAFMLLIPFAFRRLGVKAMIAIGVLAWVVRYVLFAYGNVADGAWMLYLGILLHGLCYDFFFVTGQIYTDRQAGMAVKNAAQGLITFATYGVGMFIGSYASGVLTAVFATPGEAMQYDWRGVWLVPAGISILIFILFLLIFKEDSEQTNDK